MQSLSRPQALLTGILVFLMLLVVSIGPNMVPFASAAPVLTITPLTWNVIGLDSNKVTDGPDTFMVGARVCNTGTTAATNVVVNFVWDSANIYINLDGASTLSRSTLAAGACADFYFNVKIERNKLAWNTTRSYHITATADTLGTVSTPTPRELYVEKLVSQSRNSVASIKVFDTNNTLLYTTSTGTNNLNLYVGQTYVFEVAASTAPGGYEQLESFLNFPNLQFRLDAANITYTMPTGYTETDIYADGCTWENNPSSTNYRSCLATGKVGDTITARYTVTILSTGMAALTTLIYDFSGSSYHYNADLGVGANLLTVTTIGPDLSVTKTDGVTTATPGQTLNYTLSYANNNPALATGVVITETVPLGTTFNPAGSTAGWTCSPNNNAGSTCLYPAGTLNGISSGSVIFSVIVNNPVPVGQTTVVNTAKIGDDRTHGADPTPANNTSTDTDNLVLSSDMTISKSDGGITATPGATVAYTLNYSNIGSGSAANVTLQDTVPANSTFNAGASTAGWSCTPNNNAGSSCTLAVGTVVAAGSGTATFAVTVVNPLAAGVVQLSNTATVSTTSPETNTSNNSSSDTTPITAAPDMTITKSDGGTSTTPGAVVAYTLSYSNVGNQGATGVVLTETVPANSSFNVGASTAGWSCTPNTNAGSTCTLSLGALAAGANGSATFAVTVVNLLPAGVTQLSNSATIVDDGSNGADPTPANNNSSDTTPITAAPDLTMSKTDGGTSTTPGAVVAYTLSYSNVGNQGATGVVLTETVPANSSFNAGASTAGWSCTPNTNAGSTCTLSLGTLAAGTSGSVTFAVTVVNPLAAGVTQLSNSASIADDGTNGADPTPANNSSTDTTPISAVPDMTITKSDGGTSTTPGAVVAYTLSYSNVGNQGATGVQITETVPANSTFNAASSTGTWSCANGSPAGTTCTLSLGGLTAGSSGTATFAVTVVNPLTAGVTQLTNSASIADDGNNGADPTPGNNSSTDITPITAAPDITITKSDGGATTTPGAVVAYTLSYSNVGNQNATGVVLTETVPANSSFNAGASTVGWSCTPDTNAGSTCTLSIGALAAGATGNVTFAVTVVNPLTAGVTQLSNTASIADDGSNGADPTPGNNSSTDITPITAAPDLRVTKSDGGGTTTPGGVVAYTLSYSNVGNQNATGVVLTETVPANSTFNATSSTGTWSCANSSPAGTTCTLSIGTLAAGASGSVTFAINVVNPLPSGVTQLSNSASIADDGTNGADPTPANNSSSDSTPVNAAPDLTISKDDGGLSVVPGGTITYVLDYNNVGNQNAIGVALTETVPANSSFNPGSSTAGWSCAPNNTAGSVCTYTIGNLAVGASGSVNFAVTAANPVPVGVTELSNTVSIDDDGSNGTDPTPVNNSATDTTPFITDPDLSILKDDGGVSVNAGSSVVYELTVINTGQITSFSSAKITEQVPANTTFDSAASTAGWSCLDGSGAGTTCEYPIPTTLAPGNQVIVNFAVKVNSPLPAGITEIDNTATVDGEHTEPVTTNNSHSDTTPVNAAPDLVVTKSDAGSSVASGGSVSYTINYSNVGTQNATGVVLTETVPANASYTGAGWTCTPNGDAGNSCTYTVGNVAVGASDSVVFSITANAALPLSVIQLSNTVSIHDDGTNGADLTPGNNASADTTPVIRPDLRVTKSDGNAIATPDANITYTITYTNTGAAPATGVVLSETVPANTTYTGTGWSCTPNNNAGSSCTQTVGSVAAGASNSLTFVVTVDSPLTSAITDTDNYVAIADDGSNGPDPTPANNTGTDTTPIDAAPDLVVTKTDGGISVAPGDQLTYTLTYTNTGNQDATGVVLTETVPANTTYSGTGWSCSPDNNAGSTCTQTIGALPAGASGSLSFVLTVNASLPAGVNQLSNTTTITNDNNNGPDPTPGNNTGTDTTPVNAAPDLVVTKSDGGVTVTPGDDVTYNLSYSNVGNQNATGVKLTEKVPANSSFKPTASTAGWVCAPDNNAGSTCTYTIGNLAVGASGAVDFAVTVASSLPAGVAELSNTVNITDDGTNGADPTPVNNSSTDTTPITTAPDLVVTKSDAGITVAPGGLISYTLIYTNTGNQGASGIVLTETVPQYSVFSSAGSTAGWSCTDGSAAGTPCNLNIGDLDVGESSTATFVVKVDSTLPAAVDHVDNVVIIADDGNNGPDPTPANNTGIDTTPVDAAPDLQVTKSDGGVSVAPGDELIYTLTYTNIGNQDATGVALTETVPANSRYTGIGWSCTPNTSANATCTISIGDLAAGASDTVTFVMTVDSPLPAGVTQLNNTVTIKDDGLNGPDPEPDNNTGTDTTPINAAPDLVVTKSDGDVSTFPGGGVAYTLTYTNTGNQNATTVVLTETIPLHSSFNSAGSTAGWNCASGITGGSSCTLTIVSLAAGASSSATFAVIVDSPLSAGVTQLDNSVSIGDDGSNGPDPDPSNNTGTDTTPIDAAPDLQVTKTDGDTSTTPGGTVVYTINYSNSANQDATGVVLTETVPANSTFNVASSSVDWSCTNGNPAGTPCTLNVGTLAAGNSGTATFAVTVVTPLLTGVTQLDNSVTIADDGTNGADPTPANNTGTDTTPIIAAPDLRVTKSDGGITAAPGASVTYTLTYTNTGTRDATGVVLTETVPASTSYTGTGWTCTPDANAGASCTQSVPDLAAGANGTASFVVTVNSSLPAGVTQLDNSVTIGDDGTNGADPTPANNTGTDTTPITAAPDLRVTKSDGGVSVAPGASATYTLTYTNTGDQDATGVVLTETVPANTSYTGTGWTCTPDANAGASCTQSVPDLAAGASGSVTFVVTVNSPLPAGVTQLDNSVTIGDDGANGSDPTPANNTGTDTTPITAAPDLRVTKSDGGVSVAPGASVTYTLTYTNTGTAGATGVVLTETVPANTSYIGTGWTCTPDANAGATCTQSVVDLAAGANGTASFVVTVNSSLPAGVTQLVNSVTIGDDGTNGADPTPANNTGTDTTPIIAAPDLQVTKSDGGVSAAPGASVTYTLTYTNTGTRGATGVVLTETVPANTSYTGTGWTCTPDANAGATCTQSVPDLAAGANGSVTFVVTVNSPLPAGVTQLDNSVTIGDDGTNGNDPTPANNTGTDTTPILYPKLTIIKDSEPATGSTISVGALITYTLKVENTGQATATNVLITDKIPDKTSYVANSAIPNATLNGTMLTWNVGNVAVGDIVTVRFTVRVLPSASATSNIVNTAYVSSGEMSELASNTIVHNFSPTAITLSHFMASSTAEGVAITWTTGMEMETAGFEIYRGTGNDWNSATKLTSHMIMGQGRNGTGSDYRWVDTTAGANTSYSYWLVEVDLQGRRTPYGPIRVVSQVAQQNYILIPLVLR